ncbi:hypothetical protein MAPG_04560 [Magnaporthiopsis poae ATCC 64411]|uniref:Uncharacterized protein n=1 Tax=Magnaporthiopsis poae (strain ATCC 64411 / 73-15) TaxID=644358 RepID=A0A0C4DX22_MAGP6|nr:hypothetical protein MAPG_04560 [Magnaporthiopsis poae ATCC 64411]
MAWWSVAVGASIEGLCGHFVDGGELYDFVALVDSRTKPSASLMVSLNTERHVLHYRALKVEGNITATETIFSTMIATCNLGTYLPMALTYFQTLSKSALSTLYLKTVFNLVRMFSDSAFWMTTASSQSQLNAATQQPLVPRGRLSELDLHDQTLARSHRCAPSRQPLKSWYRCRCSDLEHLSTYRAYLRLDVALGRPLLADVIREPAVRREDRLRQHSPCPFSLAVQSTRSQPPTRIIQALPLAPSTSPAPHDQREVIGPVEQRKPGHYAKPGFENAARSPKLGTD